MFKKYGSKWSAIAKEFRNRTENQVKNRFYSTLRRIATKKKRENPNAHIPEPKSKNDLLQYVDDALEYGHSCCSKRGRMKKRPEPAAPAVDEVAFMPFSFARAKLASQSPLFFPYMSCFRFPQNVVHLPVTMTEYPAGPVLYPSGFAGSLQEPTVTAASMPEPPNLLTQMQAKLREVALLQQNIIDTLMENKARGEFPRPMDPFSRNLVGKLPDP